MILTINCGSSSIKYALFSKTLKEIKRGNIEGVSNHENSLKSLVGSLSKEEIQQINTIGHRIVHGGEKFTKATKITPQVLEEIEKLSDLAPLHNPINILGVKICQKIFPQAQHIAVFDTSFHSTMTPEHFLYAIPQEYYQKYAIRKYGFHGTSHKYLREIYKNQYANKSQRTHKIITCHLGSGASITLIKNGKVIETSMGFTPLEGLIMGTRSGNIDPAILPFLAKKENLSLTDIETILNKKSGLLGISGKTNNMKNLIETYYSDSKSKLAITMFVNSIIKYIGAYFVLAKGVDAIIFSGGIGERSEFIRTLIKKKLKHLENIKYYTIPTNEEFMIAKECSKI